jgi:hypothetical protein
VRGEDAAEILTRLKGRRVLCEPASMELRFTEEALRPKIELDLANGGALRIRVVFELPSTGRRHRRGGRGTLQRSTARRPRAA